MSIIDKLATSIDRRDEKPNQELAREIAENNDAAAVKELAELLSSKNKDIRHDCIKTLYEIGYIKPELIAPYADVFIGELSSKNNRTQWGAMSAVACIAGLVPDKIFSSLATIIDIADKGTVITTDNCVRILVKLCGCTEYAESAFALLNEQLLKAPTNQLPMYAEFALPIITDLNKATFLNTLEGRLGDMDKESKRKRVEKVITKLTAKKKK